MKLNRTWGRAVCFFTAVAALTEPATIEAAPSVKLANHPTARLTGYRALRNARRLQGKIYFGYGNWIGYPAVGQGLWLRLN